MSERVAVFIDYQNTYMSARRVFHSPQSSPHHEGQFWPDRLGQYLTNDGPPGSERELQCVHVYRGIPDSNHDPRGYSAARRQIDAWEKEGNGKVKVHTRPLRYPRGWPNPADPSDKPGEKGVDVELAVDMAMKAVRGEYEIAVLVSVDTDLRPPLEAVARMIGRYPRVEVAAWSVPDQHCRRLSLKKINVFCHWVAERDYRLMSDDTNYARG